MAGEGQLDHSDNQGIQGSTACQRVCHTSPTLSSAAQPEACCFLGCLLVEPAGRGRTLRHSRPAGRGVWAVYCVAHSSVLGCCALVVFQVLLWLRLCRISQVYVMSPAPPPPSLGRHRTLLLNAKRMLRAPAWHGRWWQQQQRQQKEEEGGQEGVVACRSHRTTAGSPEGLPRTMGCLRCPQTG